MEEIALQFCEELQELIDRYKTRLSVPRIMHVAEQFLRDTDYTKPRPGSEPNAFRGPNAICSQGPDGCCATYKGGWDKCKGCGMYHGGNKCID